jgi:enterobactin synthetase component D
VPAGICQVSVDVAQAAESFGAIDVPPHVQGAVPGRQLQYRAGRFCALEALRTLAPGRQFDVPARGPGGQPVWPDGFTGSVTHTAGFASAAVARTDGTAAIGIDTEEILSTAASREIAPAVALPGEIAAARRAGCDRLTALTLVFSAKEAIFKCLYSSVGRLFDFHDIRFLDADPAGRLFRARVVGDLGRSLPAGLILEGRFDIEAPLVHTGMILPSLQQPADRVCPPVSAGR